MLIRSATPADIPVMIQLEKHSATAGHWSREQYEQVFAAKESPSMRQVSILVIQVDNKVVGFLAARSVDPEWEIENIAIQGEARRRGLGSRLVGQLIDLARAKGGTAVLLEVRESNRAARSLYEKWAFVENGRRRGYYRDPEEDAILYRLELS
ncbi:MAG TPA: ribosomal protein S18-alanine N-acetyltransferase [Terriglobales bacterium]|nr:ribosomal protein S18-alanine N-acetyltransferase [Terriglobales bacterium]